MNFWQQLRDAVRGQIEDFFDARWQAVVILLAITGCFILYGVLRMAPADASHRAWRSVLLLCVLGLASVLPRFLKR